MPNVYDISADLVIAGHGDKIEYLSSWYMKYQNVLSHQALRMILVRQGFLPNPLDEIRDLLRN